VPSPAAPSTAAPVAKPEPKSEPRAAEPKAPASAKAPAAVAEAPKSDAKPADRTAAAKTAPDKAPVKKAPAEKPAGARASAAAKSSGGDYFVQVGAFRDQATAQRVASRLREQSYPVDESLKRTGDAPSASPRPAPAPRATASGGSGSDRYDVIVSGGSSAEINTRLAAKGLASEPAGDSVRIRPSLSLRDAVALSKDLGSEGFKVQVRRGGGGGAVSAEPAPSAAPAMDSGTGGQTLYRVRVGGYPDRATAQAVLKELQDKGYQPFIAKGRE
jgi:cell division septation protein DedD